MPSQDLAPQEAAEALAAELEKRATPEDLPQAIVNALNGLLHEAQYPEAAALCRRFGAPESITYALVHHSALNEGRDEGLAFDLCWGFPALVDFWGLPDGAE